MGRQDSRVEIRVELLNGEDRDGMVVYPPGAIVPCRIEIMSQKDISYNRLLIQLKWYTEGKGDRDEQVIEQKELSSGTLTAGIRIADDLTFALPDQPWSYAGHYINIVWAIHVKIDIPRARDVNFSQPFVMAPAGERATPEPAPDSTW